MSAELAARAPMTVLRSPGTVIIGLIGGRAARSALVWGSVFGLYVASSALGYAATYATAAERTQLAATFGVNVGFTTLIGPAHQIGTVTGFTAWRSLGVLSIVGGVWGVLTGTRLLRGEEDAGRWEMLLAGQSTRRSATAKALAGLAVGLFTLWAVTAICAIAVGRAGTVGIAVGPALFLAVALVSSAGIFLAAGALASQLLPTRRQAAACTAAGLGVCFAVRMVADSGVGLTWLRWFSPLGWVEELQPLTSPEPLVLLPIVALIGVLGGLAVHLAGRRDLAAGIVADDAHARPHTRLLSGPVGLAIRLTRGVFIGWAVSIALGALLMGLVATSVGDVLSSDAGDRELFAKMGYRGSGAAQYLALTFLIVALLLSLAAAGQMNAIRHEEARGRLEHLMVRPLSRHSWIGGRLVVVAGGLVAASLVAGLAAWLGAASSKARIGLGPLLGAGLNVVPPAVFVLGVGTLILGVWPRAVPVVTYALIAWSFLVELMGGVLSVSHWVLDTSLFHQMTAAPAISPNWTSNAILVGLGAAAAAAGALAFGRRDLAAE